MKRTSPTTANGGATRANPTNTGSARFVPRAIITVTKLETTYRPRRPYSAHSAGVVLWSDSFIVNQTLPRHVAAGKGVVLWSDSFIVNQTLPRHVAAGKGSF